MDMTMWRKIGRCKYELVAVSIVAASWITAQVHAEDKPATAVDKAKPAAKADQVKPSNVTRKDKHLFYPALTKREEALQSALQSDTEAKFPEIPLDEVVIYFSEVHNIPISIQTKDLEDVGMSIDQPISFDYSMITLKNALLQILDPLNLTYVVDREMILITSKAKAAEMMKTRIYPVGDLCSSPDDYLSLEHAIRNSKLGNWKVKFVYRASTGYGGAMAPSPESNAKGGTISVVPQSKSLVITQTYHTQNAITELLKDLRKARADQQQTTDKEL